MFDEFRKNQGLKKIVKELKDKPLKSALLPFDKIKSAVVVFEYNPETYEDALSIQKLLRNDEAIDKVQLMAYVPIKKTEELDLSHLDVVVGVKDLAWNGLVNGEATRKLEGKDFDLMWVLGDHPQTTIWDMIRKCPAKMRIGASKMKTPLKLFTIKVNLEPYESIELVRQGLDILKKMIKK